MIRNMERPESPFFEPTEEKHRYITSREKIHRIRCMVSYYATTSAIYSPSEIWLQLPNHISAKLVLPLNNPPLLETNIAPNIYVMTPINDKKLVRARILQVGNNGIVTVRLIDTGKVDTRTKNKLYEMNDELRTHPWQAIDVALHNVIPRNEESWSPEEVSTIQFVLTDYPYLWVEPQLSQKTLNDDSQPVRVLLNGLSDEDVELIETTQKTSYEELGESIIDKYFMDLHGSFLAPKRIVDAMDYEVYPVETK